MNIVERSELDGKREIPVNSLDTEVLKMPCRVGITTRPEKRKTEWEQIEPSMRNWRLFGPFLSRQNAQQWENKQPGEKHGGGHQPDTPDIKWYGYRFDYG